MSANALAGFGRKTAIGLFGHSLAQSNSASVIERLDAKELIKLVQTLSPGYRMVFNLYVLEGMKHREIAEILGISEGTSKSNLADARVILKKALTVNKKVAGL